jgi:hypothetical protein
MSAAVSDRRKMARFDAGLLDHLKATVRPGNAVALVNLAAGGALVQSRRPLRPGVRIHFQITGGTHIVRVGGHVVRCMLASISADEVTYLGAVEFDTLCDLPWAERRPADARRRDGEDLP